MCDRDHHTSTNVHEPFRDRDPHMIHTLVVGQHVTGLAAFDG